MKLIEEFEYSQRKGDEVFYIGLAKIGQELIRRSIQFKGSNGDYLKLWGGYDFSKSKFLSVNPYLKKDNSFSLGQLNYLSKKFNFVVKQYKKSKAYDGFLDNDKYQSRGTLIYIEQNNVNYLVIYFERWQFDYQPRGAGEDALGMDVMYVHGIWENPDLTDDIIKTIKL